MTLLEMLHQYEDDLARLAAKGHAEADALTAEIWAAVDPDTGYTFHEAAVDAWAARAEAILTNLTTKEP